MRETRGRGAGLGKQAEALKRPQLVEPVKLQLMITSRQAAGGNAVPAQLLGNESDRAQRHDARPEVEIKALPDVRVEAAGACEHIAPEHHHERLADQVGIEALTCPAGEQGGAGIERREPPKLRRNVAEARTPAARLLILGIVE